MPASILFVLFISSLVGPALARNRHVITIASPALLLPLAPALAWDPSGQHFVAGSLLGPHAASVSDAGVVETLISGEYPALSSSVAALAVDDRRRRLLAAFSNPPLIASFDLRSPRPHRQLFASPIPGLPTSIAVDPSSGAAYITVGSGENPLLAADLDGRISAVPTPERIGRLGSVAAHTSRGFLLAVEEPTGRMWRVDPEAGAAKEVLLTWKPPGPPAVLAMRSDGTLVAAGNRTVRIVKSDDGWMGAGVADEAAVGGGRVRGVAVREGRKVYVMVGPAAEEEVGEGEGEGRWRVEEVEWEGEKDGDWVWGLILVVLGMAYFVYWRFQMGQLVTNLNKKRA